MPTRCMAMSILPLCAAMAAPQAGCSEEEPTMPMVSVGETAVDEVVEETINGNAAEAYRRLIGGLDSSGAGAPGSDANHENLIEATRYTACLFDEQRTHAFRCDEGDQILALEDLARVLDDAAAAAYQQGDTERAVRLCFAILRMSDHAAQQGVLLGSFVAGHIADIAINRFRSFDPGDVPPTLRHRVAERASARAEGDVLGFGSALAAERVSMRTIVHETIAEHAAGSVPVPEILAALGRRYNGDTASFDSWGASIGAETWPQDLLRRAESYERAYDAVIDAWDGGAQAVRVSQGYPPPVRGNNFGSMMSDQNREWTPFIPPLHHAKEFEDERRAAFARLAEQYWAS